LWISKKDCKYRWKGGKLTALGRDKLWPGEMVRGWLLARCAPMPAELQAGESKQMTVAIIGANHREYTSTITVLTERGQKKIGRRRGQAA
jgi:hypothetical protein